MRLFCFGFGYAAESLAHKLLPRNLTLAGTTTSPSPEASLPGLQLAQFTGDTSSKPVRDLLEETTHVLVSIPPDLEGDVVLRHHAEDLAALTGLVWVGYLSTIGVYGDWRGAWVDETSPARPTSERSFRRLQSEGAWIAFGQKIGKRTEIFRLAGIYGPGRSVIDNLRRGTARRIVKHGQIFNRIHVDDIARTLAAAIDKATDHNIYNVCDDEPAPPEDVVAYAAELLGLPVPPEIPYDQAGLSGMAASFWTESKRVKNERLRKDLGVELVYPTYREGLRALAGG
jgi:nucleoside-diphosphate-sugar epimerase